MNTDQIILDEVRAMRASFEEFAADMRERVATLEAHDHDLSGNGQPGRMSDAELRLTRLEHWRMYVLGGAAALATIVNFALKFLLG